jgi:hypothetical protein
VPFFAHIDEFHSFGTDAFASLLSEARKFAAHFCLGNQYIDQLAPSVRAAVLGNAGTLLVFRVSGADAVVLASEFDPMPPTALVDQRPHTAWLRRGIGHDHGAVATAVAERERAFGDRLAAAPRHPNVPKPRRGMPTPRVTIVSMSSSVCF